VRHIVAHMSIGDLPFVDNRDGKQERIDVNGFGTFSNHYQVAKGAIQKARFEKTCSDRKGSFCMPDDYKTDQPATLGELTPRFLRYAQLELQFAPQSLIKYQDCLRMIGRILGDRLVSSYTEEDITNLKAAMLARGHGVSRQVSLLSAIKRFLEFCSQKCGYAVLPTESITIPKRPRREVIYLTVDEVQRFLAVIPARTLRDRPHLPGLRFRTLVEVLLGTAMRISEVLSLDRTQVDFTSREARIIGKGDKQRTAFFTARSLEWLSLYLKARTDNHPALFVCMGGKARLKRADIWRPFTRYRKLAGINKPVTPHLLRHTAATQLLFNGCPVGHIKEILGHERLETTCRYYLGLDHRAAKQAHQRYLVYSAEATAA
jgi:site-specific recombinase XerD